ncbi:Hydroxyethylthiazole kinase family-domain-containing protein [Elsinoe ampelina]|uniref:Hydroxyethylthiazole kinase family-domain-containing protein n=1 Tax=Elsinoe ampelina TaxID=302913 RepID=A0A6A6GHP1_9PEZI|nr:Hydroxyethylthiazole kinase family-domain-containing protein [Elsinoe ampelina]
MDLSKVDYWLYLVTDNTPAILGGRDLIDVVKKAVEGGTTIVQLRDKTSETSELIRIATQLREICHNHNVPLIINDRVDVALASDADGVHLGQDDFDVVKARQLFEKLGKKAIIGATVCSIEEAKNACSDGADYLGIGTVFATPTKENTKSIIGTAGTQAILAAIEDLSPPVRTVCIGGINASNLQRVIYQSTTAKGTRLSGVAVVSAIIAATDPASTSRELRSLIDSSPAFVHSASTPASLTDFSITSAVPTIIARMANAKPLCHNMTNLVVQNFAANVAICIGASPIMSNNAAEAADLADLGGSLVINMGTTTPDVRAAHLTAVKAYNAVGGPILLDPVGAGATAQRREGTRALLAGGYFDVIKGNEGEIRTVAGAQGVKQRGVDSGAATLDLAGRAGLVKEVAQRERCVVLMTGETDVVSDGQRTVGISNGHKLLGEITGSGCTLGTTIASVLAVQREDKLLAVVVALLMYEIAAERAASKTTVKGPGTFVPAFLDELYAIREECLKDDGKWVEAAKIQFF